MARREFARFLACALLCLGAGCAKVGVPPGGDEDKIAPTVVNVFPAQDAVQVDKNTFVELEFSEFVNRPSVESSLYLSPEPGQRLKYHWSGRTLRLYYLDPLVDGRTYVVSVGSDAKDMHGNSAGESFTLAFSTGDSIDRGRFRGWISEGESPQALSIFVYDLAADSLPDPMLETAEYRLQADKSGQFQMDYLRVGRYRAFAIADRNFDGLWNPSAEWIAVPPWDLVVTDSSNPWISFDPMLFDTASVEIRRTKSINDRRVDVRLSHEVKSLVGYFENNGGDSIAILDALPDTANINSWIVFPDSSLSEGDWILFANGADELSNVWQDSTVLSHESRPDTTIPRRYKVTPQSHVPLLAPLDSLLIEFDEPVSISVSDSDTVYFHSGNDTILVQLKSSLPRFITLVPDSQLLGGRYSLSLNGHCITDISGNLLSDSLVTFDFDVLPEDSLGTITGTLESSNQGVYILDLFSAQKHIPFKSKVITPGPFAIERLPAGEYIYELTLDQDGNLIRSLGRPNPLTFSEPFQIGSDTLTVRARWESETVISWTENP